MPTIIDWQNVFARPRDVSYFLQHPSRSAGVSILGDEQIIQSGIQKWQVTLELPRDFNRVNVRGFEVAVTQMKGQLNLARLRVCDPYRYGEKRSPLQEPWDDLTWFDDGTGFVGLGTAPMRVTAGGLVGGNTVVVALTNPVIPPFEPGDYFSYNGFLYRVMTAGVGGTVTFEPKLRTAIPAGAVLQTDPPQIICRFADENQGERIREYLRWGAQTTLTFVEAFDRP